MIINLKRLLKGPLFWILIATPILVVAISSLIYIMQGGDASYTPNITPYRNFDALLAQINKTQNDLNILNENFQNGFISKIDYTKTYEQLSKELNALKLLYENRIPFNDFNYGTYISNFPHEKFRFFQIISRVNLVSFLFLSFIYVFAFIGDRFKNDTWKYCFQNRNRNIILKDFLSGLILIVISYFLSSGLIFIFSSPLYLQSSNIIKSYVDDAVLIKYQEYVFSSLFGNFLLVTYFYIISSSLAFIFRKPTKTFVAYIVPTLIIIIPNIVMNLEKYNFFYCVVLPLNLLIYSNTSTSLIIGGQVFLSSMTAMLFFGSYYYFQVADFH